MGKVQIINPREHGVRTHDLKLPVFDAAAVARADEALESMSGSFEQWLDGDVARMQAARLAAEKALWGDASLQELWGAAHELKGLGATYGYPVVTEMAASLCRLIETPAGKAAARRAPGLVCAHIDAMRAAVRDRIQTADHPIGRALSQALAREVEKLGVAPR